MRTVLWLMAAVLAAATIGPAPTRAESGTGLYAPFPSPSGGAWAQRFVGELGVRTDRAALDRGVALHGLRDTPAPHTAAASTRAGTTGDHPTTALLTGAALALVVTAASAIAVRRRARHPLTS